MINNKMQIIFKIILNIQNIYKTNINAYQDSSEHQAL